MARAWPVLASLAALGCGGGDGAPPASAEHSSRPLAPELRLVARAAEERRFDVARALAQQYVDAHPQDGQGLYFLGMTHYWTGNYGAARPWLERVLEVEPDIAIAHESLAYCLFMLGELDAARREYEVYAAIAPGEPKGPYGLGLIELEETKMEAAEARFRQAITLLEALDPRSLAARQPELAECHARLGEVHFARGEYEAARAELERATALCPGNISAFYTLGLVYRRLGQEELAARALARYESARQALVVGPEVRDR